MGKEKLKGHNMHSKNLLQCYKGIKDLGKGTMQQYNNKRNGEGIVNHCAADTVCIALGRPLDLNAGRTRAEHLK